jgi:signal transduction histidine kinase
MAAPPSEAHAGLFAVETRAEWRQAARLGSLVSLAAIPFFAVQDLLADTGHAVLFMELRLGCLAVTAGILWLLGTPFGQRHPRALALVQGAAVALMMDVITLWTGGGTSPRYAGLNLLLLGGAVLMPWTPFLGGVVAFGVVALYAALTVVTGNVGDARSFTTQLFYLNATAAVAVVAGGFRERLRRREFESRMALVEALHMQSDFTAKWSHEVRTPLSVMIGYADILLDEALDQGAGESRRLVQRIRGNGIKLRNLISDLLDFAKAEAGQMKLHREPVSVAEVLEEVADTFRPVAERKGLDVRTGCSGSLPAVVTDRQRLCQVLTNLVANAVKFTERGSVAIEALAVDEAEPGSLEGFTVLEASIRGRGASLAANGPRPEVVILVRDSGIGIREPDLARLAADYQQLDARKYGGTGLGLSISKKLAQLLGGRVAVRSRYEEGSTFALFLPLDAPECRVAA